MRLKLLFFLLISLNTKTNLMGYEQTESTSIVFVHGFLRSSANMSALTRSFKKDGWPVVNWSYPSRQKNIEGHAEDLTLKLKEIAQANPGRPISFVTHSMGGLVVRCALNHAGCPEEAKIGRAVLIAPPNRGSILARHLHSFRLIRQILGKWAGNQLMTTPLDGFDQLGNFPEHMPVMVISGTAGLNPFIPGKNDGKVGLAETRLATPHLHVTTFACHSWICYSRKTISEAKIFFSGAIRETKS